MTNTREALEQMVNSTAAGLTVPDYDEDDYDEDDYDDLVQEIFDGILEVRAEGYQSSPDEDMNVTEWRICVTIGGPNIFVTYDGDRTVVTGYWGHDEFTAYPDQRVAEDWCQLIIGNAGWEI